MPNSSWCRERGGAVDGAEREGGEMHICMSRAFVGGRGASGDTAAVTVQFLSKGHCTARVTRLGLTVDQLVPG